MLGHVLSNLFIENIRLTQAGIYAKSPVKCEYLREIAQKEVEYFFKISDLLLDENEIVPSTTEEFLKYHKFITEDPKAKYWTDEDLLESFIVDVYKRQIIYCSPIYFTNCKNIKNTTNKCNY